ncbi:MAG: hypothetical protein ACD_36C00172G0004 [uncultured bacterium]|uniref:Type II secretion system protein GspG C-terminal domain-containing protein n=1 Tax=Candidatus Gottesmanbacteria bacterium RIFCSPLOWO2_01_FULL_43_11b TaxID=1798392 RepID=A0A1F6AFZ9_9BACT|nr:MAG: hypothetical protein ACD_36C00172G0004 [uncultured bacterium]OGG23688.1 MAG: hypothetical protein A3A79_00570 [Candidatus Gottesmanbacteria bacterium RIFCSPLOWO2_01_FULL_43_11b]
MKKYLSHVQPAGRQGFTLVELLIVIALLGALAIGLLATVDPFEQLKKGRDTSVSNMVAEFLNANLRYYSTKGQFTWGTGTTFTARGADTMGSDITSLVNAGELKNRFMDIAGTGNLAKMLVTSTAVDHLAVCYDPESKTFNANANTVYGSGGLATSGCISESSGGLESCFYCVQ